MDDHRSLIHAIDEIANLHDLGKRTSQTLREVTLHTIAIEKLLIEKGVITVEDLEQAIEKQKHP